MKLRHPTSQMDARRTENGSVLIIVLWIAVGLVSIALYFANSMTFELRASDNRTSGLTADQAIEGAARYVSHVLSVYATNGTVPLNTQFSCDTVPVGDAHFWIIGRDPTTTTATKLYFGLVDEGSKLNLNTANTNVFSYLPDMTPDIADAIVDWRSTNGSMALSYAQLGYDAKHAPFESLDELRLVDGITLDLLTGADANHNGIVDTNEKNLNGTPDFGLLEYLTVYSREPNFHTDGSTLTNANNQTQLRGLLASRFGTSRASQIMTQLGFGAGGPPPTFSNPLRFYQRSGLNADDFGQIYDELSFTNSTYIRGRVNVNTASADVLYALFQGLGIDQNTASGAAEQLVSYRQQNSGNLATVAWVADSLGNGNTVLQALRRGDYITTRSYQFTADIAATGQFGRGYRRVKFIFDTSDGSPKIIYRQDLSRLGWALGDNVRETLLAKETP